MAVAAAEVPEVGIPRDQHISKYFRYPSIVPLCSSTSLSTVAETHKQHKTLLVIDGMILKARSN